MATKRIIPGEIRIFLNHIYEFKKGIRNMVLYTMSKEHEEFAIRRLKNQKISYMIQEVGTNKSTCSLESLNVWKPCGISSFAP